MSGNRALTPVPAADAALGRGDPTRRHGVRGPDGACWFPGLTRPEAEQVAARGLAGIAPEAALVRVVLPVVLSDGAGPYLIDAEGVLTLVVGPHPSGMRRGVAMSDSPAGARVGVAEPIDDDELRWRWVAEARVPATARAPTIDALLGAADDEALAAWGRDAAARGGAGGA